MKSSPDQKYLETSIATASKEDLILRIFDYLILSAQQALEKMQSDATDIEGIHRLLLRAQRACCLLMGSLDMEIGGDLSRNLFRVYEFWHHELVMTNMQKDLRRLERTLPYFREYRTTWAQAIAQFKIERHQAAGGSDAVSSFGAVG